MSSVYTGCSSGAPPMTVEELTIADVHEQLLNGTFTCAQLVQAYLQVRSCCMAPCACGCRVQVLV